MEACRCVDATQSDDDGRAEFYDKVPKQFLYSRKQAADTLSMGLPRLDELIRARKITAVKDGSRIKFTPADLQAYVDSLPRIGGRPSEPEQYPGGLTRRSWLYWQRYGIDGNPHHQRPRRRTTGTEVEPPKVQPVPRDFRFVRADRRTSSPKCRLSHRRSWNCWNDYAGKVRSS